VQPAEPLRSGDRPRVTGIVTCYNEETNIDACLESMRWCDEILVVDSYSTDATVEIAERHDKVRVVRRRYLGGASQKNWAIELAAHPWVFILDADERCTPELQREIEDLLRVGPEHDAYWIARRSVVLGRELRFSGWQHDRVIRLFRKGRAYYRNRRVHEEMLTVGTPPQLRHPMSHELIDDFREYMVKISRYGYWGAAQYWRDGRRSSFLHILIRPIWRFLRMYLLQLGFLDGTRGLAFCMLQAHATYVKWSLLWAWQLGAGRGHAPALPEFDEDEEVWSGLHRLEREREQRRGGAPRTTQPSTYGVARAPQD